MDNINLNGDNWSPKIKQRSRGRMKIGFKLSKDEALSFSNWMKVVRPDEINDDNFFKTIFFNGIEYLNKQLQTIAQAELERQKATELSKETEVETDASKD